MKPDICPIASTLCATDKTKASPSPSGRTEETGCGSAIAAGREECRRQWSAQTRANSTETPQLDSKQQDADRKAAEHLDTHRRDDEGRTGAAAVEHHPLGISWGDFLLLEQRSDGFGAHRIPADHPQQQDAAQLRGKKEQPAGHPGKGEGKKTV